jgi:hypothetical protein
VASPLTLADAGGGRSTDEASLLTWRRLPQRRLVITTGVAGKMHQARVAARRTPQNIFLDTSNHLAGPRSVREDVSEAYYD